MDGESRLRSAKNMYPNVDFMLTRSPAVPGQNRRARARDLGRRSRRMYRGEAPPPPPPRGPLPAAVDGTEVRMWTLEAIAECLTRRARKQHDPEVGPSRERAFDSASANAWYGASASRGGGCRQQPEAMTRCDAVLDSGRTRGECAVERRRRLPARVGRSLAPDRVRGAREDFRASGGSSGRCPNFESSCASCSPGSARKYSATNRRNVRCKSVLFDRHRY